jgi:hypothetical protein
MEGLVWLLIKMAVLLALAGVVYFAFGWWLRGRQVQPVVEIHPTVPAEDIEHIKAATRAAEIARDAARQELASLRSQLAAAENEVQRLLAAAEQHEAQKELAAQTPPARADAVEELVLQFPEEPATRPKTKRKPRAKKKTATEATGG